MDSYARAGFIIGITLLTILGTTLIQQVYAAIEDGAQIRDPIFFRQKAPIATSGDMSTLHGGPIKQEMTR
jgi:hypothetical protein